MKLRFSEPKVLIDIARIPGLSGISQADGMIQIGAGTTHHAVATNDLIRSLCPALSDCAGEIGDPQVRNRGTIGGSLAHSDPSADYPAMMIALDAEVHIKGPNGWRAPKAADFFQDMFTVDLAEDELIVAVKFAPVKNAGYAKLHQKASHYAIVGVGASLKVEDGTITNACLGLTGASSHAQRMTNVESALAGQPATQSTIDHASQLAGEGLDNVSSDIHASEAYRRAMVKVFTRRALEAALARA
jgi:carbon-monoxide dehydrogenase medium subunit